MTTPLPDSPNVRPRILVVDDQPIIARTFHELFHADHDVFVATDGQPALDFCRDNPLPDLVLLDVVMPGMDGLETCRRLKADPATRDIPVIFVTAQSDPLDETRALEAGGVDFISKPVNPAVVRARVKTHLTLKAQSEHLERLVEARTTALSIAKEAAETASRAKTAFLATVSHELRTPMNGIMGFTALAQCLASDPKLRSHLSHIEKAAQQLLSLIDDILDYSRIEADHLNLEPCDFHLGELLAEIEQLAVPQATAKGLALHVETSEEISALALHADAKRLKQILLHLVGNAVKFTATGSVSLHASRGNTTGERVPLRFEVSDTGVGIAEADRRRIFEPFEQADGRLSRQHGGLGIGLTLARRLARLMGGDLDIVSTSSAGSIFRLTLSLQERA